MAGTRYASHVTPVTNCVSCTYAISSARGQNEEASFVRRWSTSLRTPDLHLAIVSYLEFIIKINNLSVQEFRMSSSWTESGMKRERERERFPDEESKWKKRTRERDESNPKWLNFLQIFILTRNSFAELFSTPKTSVGPTIRCEAQFFMSSTSIFLRWSSTREVLIFF